jgi:hypothetical protein
METRDGPRTLKWVRSLDPECGLLEFSPSDDPAWFFERTQSADAYGLEMEKWFHAQVLKRRKAQIQFRQGERVWFNTTAELAAWRFAGKTYAEIARRNQTEPDTVRKAVDAYCARTGLLMPGAVRRDASVN